MSSHWGRHIQNVPVDPAAEVRRTCSRCKNIRPIKGGSIINHKFICAECKA